MLIEQRIAELGDSQHDEHQERQDQGEFDDALAARARPGAGSFLHWNLLSFFIEDWTLKLISPFVKNGRIRGVKICQL